MKQIFGIIRRLGITANYKGYYYLADGIMLAMELGGQPLQVTKQIYPLLAAKYHTTTMNIEHDIRTVISLCWQINPEGLADLAGFPLKHKPTNSEMIDMAAYYLLSQRQEEALEMSNSVYLHR